MKDIKFKPPQTIQDLRLYHLEAIAQLDPTKLDVYDKLKLCVKLTDLDMETLRRVSINDINTIIDHYFKLINDYVKVEPPKEIEINKKKYTLIKGVGEQPLSWHIDISHFDTKDASIVAAFNYIEKGMRYCEQDENKNILNPVKVRAEEFRDNMGVDIYTEIGFFLQKKYEQYNNALTEIRSQRIKMKKKDEQDLTMRQKSTSLIKN